MEAMETMVRSFLARPDPPAVALFNVFLWTNFWHCSGRCAYLQSCDPYLNELGSYYHASVVAMRSALWHEAHRPKAPQQEKRRRQAAHQTGLPTNGVNGSDGYQWRTWTIEGVAATST